MNREEAIETIRMCCPKVGDSQCDFESALRELIPELRESEDERIRKFLVEILSHGTWRKEWPFEPNEVVAYLEKQKEQSFTHHEIDESLQDAVTHQMEDDGDVDDFVRRGIDDIALKYAMLGAEWQKEQKPAEWSEEDVDMLNSCISSIEEAKENRYAYKETDGDTSYDHEIAWLKSLRPKRVNVSDQLPERPKLKSMNIPSGGGAMGTTPPKFKLEVKPEQPVEVHIDNPNIEKIDPSIKVETRTDGTGDIDDGKAMLYVAEKSYKIGFRDGKASKEQPAEGLEEEMEKFFETMPVLEHENIFEDTFKNIASHFAEWGAEHLKK